MVGRSSSWWWAGLGLACVRVAPPEEPGVPDSGTGLVDTAASTTQLSTRQVLVRASLDLRGIRPSGEELAAVEDNPEAIGSILDEYVQDERFPGRVRSLGRMTALLETFGRSQLLARTTSTFVMATPAR